MKIEESISKLKRFKYHAIGRLELEDAIDDVVSWYEQLLKDAVEAEVLYFGGNQGVPRTIKIPRMQEWLKPFGNGDKVKLIIVKEE